MLKKLGQRMSRIKELEELLISEVLPEVNENIKELEEIAQKKKKNKDAQAELNYMIEVKKYFDEVIEDINAGNLKEDDADSIILNLEEMRTDNV